MLINALVYETSETCEKFPSEYTGAQGDDKFSNFLNLTT